MKLPQIILLLTSALLTGCGSSKHIQTVPIETNREHQVHDTIYINNVLYDSIYVSQNRYTDRSKDTILIRQHDVEYRYKLLRDTIHIVQCDSIPYQVTIIKTKEVVKPPTFFDKICQYSFFLLLGAFLLIIFRFFRKIT